MTVTLLGPDFIVNTTTLNSQSEPSIAALSDGRFVITWHDSSGTDIDVDCCKVGTFV